MANVLEDLTHVLCDKGCEVNSWNQQLAVNIGSFAARYAGDPSFRAEQNVMDALLAAILSVLMDDGVAQAQDRFISTQNIEGLLLVLKICARDPHGNRSLRQPEYCRFLMGKTGLCGSTPVSLSSLELEAVKCVINLLMCDDTCRRISHELRMTHGALQLVKHLRDCDYEWIIFRLLFAISVGSDARMELSNELGAVELCIQKLERMVREDRLADPLATEIFSLLFCITDQAPSGSDISEDMKNKFTRIAAVIPLVFRSPLSSMKMKKSCIDIMMNIPPSLLASLIDSCPQIMDVLVGALAHSLENGDPYGKDMLSIMSVIQGCVEASIGSLHYFRRELLPDYEIEKKVEISPPECPPQSLKSKLLKYFNSPVAEVQHVIGKLFFALCEEDPNKFTSELGLGHAAGLLANMGLLHPGGPAE